MADQVVAPFVLTALRAIAQDPGTYGREFRTSPALPSRHSRIAVVALSGDRQLWMMWIPGLDPIEVVLLLMQRP
jgi:hypothetical protein